MDYTLRVKKLQKFLKNQDCDAIVIDDVLNIFYLTGQRLSCGSLYVSQKQARLIVDSRYYESCKTNCPFSVILLEGDSLKQILASKLFKDVEKLGFDSQNTSYEKYLALKKTLKGSSIKLIPFKNPVLDLRMIKDPEEIVALKEAAILGSEGFDYVCSLLKTGITEIEIARELEIFWKRKGSQGVAFESIIAFGPNSSMPHYRPGDVKLKKGMPVLVDIGVNYKHYHSDMTRVPFFGKPSSKMIEIYEVVKKAQEAALKLCKPGTVIGEIDAAARKVISDSGYGEYFTHSLGHGVGLEIHELPVMRGTNRQALESGMVITIEPGVYLPGEGGVRLEDSIVITPKGYEDLTLRSKELLLIS